MDGMLLTMTFSMTNTLTLGVLIGNMQQGFLFQSTLFSIFIGIAAGVLCGMGLGLNSTIEGAMTGIMGGMMGAMLGEMIQKNEASIVIMIMLTLSLSSLLLYFILLRGVEHGQNEKIRVMWLVKPVFVFGILCFYLLYGFHLSQAISGNTMEPEHGKHEVNH